MGTLKNILKHIELVYSGQNGLAIPYSPFLNRNFNPGLEILLKGQTKNVKMHIFLTGIKCISPLDALPTLEQTLSGLSLDENGI